MARRPKKTCLGCKRNADTRGLCRRCYQVARYAIETKKTTEQELIDAGLLLAAYAEPKSDYSKMLAKLLANPRRKQPCPPKPTTRIA